MTKKISKNKNIYRKKSNKKGGRPPGSADQPSEEQRLKQLETDLLKRQAEIAAEKALPSNIGCTMCLEGVAYLNSPVYPVDEHEHKKGEPKVPVPIMRCPLGDHFICAECFEKQVWSQCTLGKKNPLEFNGREPLYITCAVDRNCPGRYSNDQIKRTVSLETYQNLITTINHCKNLAVDSLCNMPLPPSGHGKILICPRCFSNPQLKENCFAMLTHHGEQKGPSSRINNACLRCSYISNTDYDFIPFTPGDKSCNMCNIIDDKQEGIIADLYYVRQAINDFDEYFKWPEFIQPVLGGIGDPGKRGYALDLFEKRDAIFNQSIIDLTETLAKENKTTPREIRYSQLVNNVLRCSRARNSFIIFLIDILGIGQSSLFTREKTIKYLDEKEKIASYLAPCNIALKSAVFVLTDGKGYHPFHKDLENAGREGQNLPLPSVDQAIFALAHYIAQPDTAVDNYKESAKDAPLTNPFVEYDDAGKQEIIKEITLAALNEIKTLPIATDEEIQRLETEAETYEARTKEDKTDLVKENIQFLCNLNINAAQAKKQSELVKSLKKVNAAINAQTAEEKIDLGKEAYEHALNSYKSHQKNIYNQFHLKAVELKIAV